MARPTICLCMIVKDEAHVVTEGLASLRPLLDAWVVVDTGSTDGTQDVLRTWFAEAGIPGELHERPWVDFGHNRTEALQLGAGKADYLLVHDADDLLVGELDLTDLRLDSYLLRFGPDPTYWRKQLFRDGLRWRYQGVVHEHPVCDDLASEARLEGDYHVESRRLGARNRDTAKYERDRALLHQAVEADPTDARSAFYLAQSCQDAGDLEAAARWYETRIELPGWDEETFVARLRRAEVLEGLERPSTEVDEAYLSAWQARPTRAEPLVALARRHRTAGRMHLAHLYAERAAAIPFPSEDSLFVRAEDHTWRPLDELAVASFYVGDVERSFALGRELLCGDDLPDAERPRVLANADLAVPARLASSDAYPTDLVGAVAPRPGGPITLTMTTCRRPHLFERTLGSFLRCCTDHQRIDRWVVVDNGSDEHELARMVERFPFLELHVVPQSEGGHATALNRLLDLVDSEWWLHLEDDWQFFAPAPYVTEALDILAAEPHVAQVTFNRAYAETVAERSVAAGPTRRTAAGTRYIVHEHLPPGTPAWEEHLASLGRGGTNAHWPHFTLRPSLVRRAAMDGIAPFDDDGFFERSLAERWTAAGHRTAYFDDVVAVHLGRRTDGTSIDGAPSAYELVGDGRHPAAGPALPIDVINLARRPDRWAALVEHAREAVGEGFARRLRRRDAVDGRALRSTPELQALFRDNDFGHRRAVIGCALSHLEVWEEIAVGPDVARLVLEDDVQLVPSFERDLPRVLAEAHRAVPGWDFVLLGHLTWDGAEPSVPTDAPVRPMRWERYKGGLFGYVLSASGARNLLDLVAVAGIQNGIDWFLLRHASRLFVAEADPALVTTTEAVSLQSGDSDIQHDIEPLAP